MNREDKEFLFTLNQCDSRKEIEELISQIDDDMLCIKMKDSYQQILEVNQDESIKNIKKILDFKYSNYKK